MPAAITAHAHSFDELSHHVFFLALTSLAMHISNDRLAHLRDTYRDGLLDDTLPFWIDHSVDHADGGFLTSLGRDGRIIDTDKAVWPQGRFTWMLAKLFNTVEARPDWLALARHGIRFIEDFCFDSTDHRMWFLVSRQGHPIRKRRYAFSESFAAIAYGEFARATGEQRYAEMAQSCLQAFLSHDCSKTEFGAKYTNHRPTRGLAQPMIAIVTAQELRESIGLPNADKLIDESIAQICEFHLNDDLECVMETVALDGGILSHFDGRTLNPGHAIEGAWFMMTEGKRRNAPELLQTGLKMLDWMWNRGWDSKFGGMLYFVAVDGQPLQEYWHDMKFWWPQCETIIATLLAYQLTGDEKYARWHTMIHDWTHEHFPDPEHGEWYGYLRRDGSVSSSAKGNHWKGPFHIPRMQLVCWRIAEEILATRNQS